MNRHPFSFFLAGAIALNIFHARSDVYVVDDGNPGCSLVGGGWQTVGGGSGDAGVAGSGYAMLTGAVSDAAAVYHFTNLPPGKYYVSASFPAASDRAAAARYALADGTAIGVLDQRKEFFDFMDAVPGAAAQTRFYRVSGAPVTAGESGELSIKVTDGGGGGCLLADAVRLETAGADVERVRVVDSEEEDSCRKTGAWLSWTPSHRTGWHYTDAKPVAEVTNCTAVFTFDGLEDGVYRISATWVGGGYHRQTVFSLPNGLTNFVDLSIVPDGERFEGCVWKDVFSCVAVTGGALSVTESCIPDPYNWSICADAVRLEKIPGKGEPAGPGFILLDDFESYEPGRDPSADGGRWNKFTYPGNPPAPGSVTNVPGEGKSLALLTPGINSGLSIRFKERRIARGSVGTVFFRFKSDSATDLCLLAYASNWGVGGTKINGCWWNYDVAGMVSIAGDGLKIRPRYDSTNTVCEIEGRTWYNAWIVVDHKNDTYDCYLSRGLDPATGGKTSVKIIDGVPLRFEVGDIDYFFVCNYISQALSDTLIDDVYVSRGENLRLPRPLRKNGLLVIFL